jgi:hypothetical protein
MKPPLPSNLSKTDAELAEWFYDAKRRGYKTALFDKDANLLDLGGMFGRTNLTDGIAGKGYCEWVDPEHVPGLLMWINGPDLPSPFVFRFVIQTKKGPRFRYGSLVKRGGDSLRFVIAAESDTPPPPQPPVTSDD